MQRRGMKGPAAFLIAFGASVALLGALMFLAIPAANRLDAKERENSGLARVTARSTSVVKSGVIGFVAGSTLFALGLYLARGRENKH